MWNRTVLNTYLLQYSNEKCPMTNVQCGINLVKYQWLLCNVLFQVIHMCKWLKYIVASPLAAQEFPRLPAPPFYPVSGWAPEVWQKLQKLQNRVGLRLLHAVSPRRHRCPWASSSLSAWGGRGTDFRRLDSLSGLLVVNHHHHSKWMYSFYGCCLSWYNRFILF